MSHQDTADALFRNKLGRTRRHPLEPGASVLVNASTGALVLTGRVIEWRDDWSEDLLGALRRLLERSVEPQIHPVRVFS